VGLHICAVVARGTDSRGEHVEIANDGPAAVAVTGIELTCQTDAKQHVPVYTFPAAADDAPLELDPGRSAYVFSGSGTSSRTPHGDLILFAALPAGVWNDEGRDVAHLRRADGRILDTLRLGRQPRHPDGH
jgi:hypothetical protein